LRTGKRQMESEKEKKKERAKEKATEKEAIDALLRYGKGNRKKRACPVPARTRGCHGRYSLTLVHEVVFLPPHFPGACSPGWRRIP